MPPWIGWLGALLAVSLVLGGLNFLWGSPLLLAILFLSLPLLLLWVATISIVILQQQRALSDLDTI